MINDYRLIGYSEIYRFAPPAPPNLPSDICSYYPNQCHLLHEPNYYDKNCFSPNDIYGGLGCNAGGLICCRFCEFSQYKDVPCIASPSLPPSPPPLPSFPPSPSLPPMPPPPNNPLIIRIDEKVDDPEKAKVKIHMRIRSTIESFDKPRFVRNFRKVFKRKIWPENINIRIRPGSLILDIALTTNVTIAENTSLFMQTFTPAILSKQLNVSIDEISEPEIINYEPFKPKYLDIIYLLIPISMLIIYIISIVCKKYKNYKKKLNEQKIEIYKKDTRLSGLEIFKHRFSDHDKIEAVLEDGFTDEPITKTYDC